MKHFVTWPFCLLLAAFFSESCRPKELPIPAEQQILFESSYINFAWGKQHNGFLIDKDGNIWVYKSPLDWNFPSADGQISSDKINDNLAKATLHSLKIPMDELHKYAFKIYTIDPKKLGARVNTANDAGAYTMTTYLYNSKTRTYQSAQISQSGDWSNENKGKPAQEIKKWLGEISKKLR